MTLGELLPEHQDAIVQRWLDDVLATYSENAFAVFKRQKDPFTNPVGHNLRVATRAIFEALLRAVDGGMDGSDGGMDTEGIRPSLDEVMKIRAVQEFSASEAVGFVFRLKEAVRAELADVAGDPRLGSELVKLERRIDRIALAAFDVFVECRERMCELRINEAKRRVPWVVAKINQRDGDPEAAQTRLE
ncbi:MAG: hypothetical protein A2V70_00955 [Planctomycetes bacterium RBG_13_63_9]|nr:MAG: hypothetical protein A2V70_00955 [Planctomycetes bacterium RBG_13_63_9]